MSDEFDRSQLNRDPEVTSRRPAEFQEVPGEAEADAVRDAFLQRAGSDPAGLASALARVDGATRAKAVNRLQEERGNAYVQRIVAESRGTPGRLVGRSQPEMVTEVLQRKGSGSPLPEGPRGQLEAHFGTDLSGVRVHTDGEATALNRELNAQAFTVGSDIFFAAGKYDPASSEGQGLLAHELTHVRQQTGLAGPGVQRQAAEEEDEEPLPDEDAGLEEEEEEVPAG